MQKLVEYLRLGCEAFGLNLEVDYSFKLPSGVDLRSVARLTGPGLGEGMLVFADAKVFWTFRSDIVDAGFGYTVLSEPEESELFDLLTFHQMIADWGWIEKTMGR